MTMTRIHHPLDAQCGAHPDAPALRDHDGRRITFAELGSIVEDLAADLAARGLKAGDRLLILAENCAALIGMIAPSDAA